MINNFKQFCKRITVHPLIIILAFVLIGASCNNESKSTLKAQDSTNEQINTAQILNVEPILKYGHVFPKDCAATSLDWSGNYVGATANKGDNPARLHLALHKDWRYNLKVMSLEYLDNGGVIENFQSETNGAFTFDSAGQIIKLIGSKHPLTSELIAVSVKENYLSMLGGDLKELSKDGDMNTLYK